MRVTRLLLAALLALSVHAEERLTATVSAESNRLLITAEGYARNLALIEDKGTRGEIIRTESIGLGSAPHAPFISANGKRFGAACALAPFGQALILFDDAGAERTIFPAFGDMTRAPVHFAVSADGNTVIAPGTFGAICWHLKNGEWKEAWALDDWKTQTGIDRIPTFDAIIAPGADHALLVFGDTARAWVASVDLATGTERWRVNAPSAKSILCPTLHCSNDGPWTLLELQSGEPGKEAFHVIHLNEGKSAGSWSYQRKPSPLALAGKTGRCAAAYNQTFPRIDLRDHTSDPFRTREWPSTIVSLAFTADGEALFLADDSSVVTKLSATGNTIWNLELTSPAQLSVKANRVYAAARNGQLHALDAATGARIWTLDCAPALKEPAAKQAPAHNATIVQASRAPAASTKIPSGENLLRNGSATLKLVGADNSESVAVLANGKFDDVEKPWVQFNTVEIEFKAPVDIRALTVHENQKQPESWPTEGFVQRWDDDEKNWKTAARGLFLAGPLNTYKLDLKAVRKIRYVPWNSAGRKLFTSEIEVR